MLDTASTGAETAPKPQGICRVARRNRYAQIPNETLRDRSLSLQARGMLAFILSYPDDWQFSKRWLMQETGSGRDRTDAILAELDAAGYCQRHQTRGADGRVGAWEYLFYDTPQPRPEKPVMASPQRENPQPENPRPANRTPTNTIRDEHQKETKTVEGDAQARPTAQVAEIVVSPPEKPKRQKAAKVDLLGEVPGRNKRNTLTTFPDNPNPDVVDQWIEYGVRIGLTDDEAKGCILKEGKYYRGTGKRMADWTPIMEGELIKCRERLAKERKRANGNRRGPANTDDAFAMAFGA
jgi:hypothetical protein